MLPFEFTVEGPPVSLQTKNKNNLQNWKQKVKNAALARIPHGSVPTLDQAEIIITYYFEGDTPDVDNIIKPIQDALVGCIYVDDNQIMDSRSRKKDINGAYKIRGASAIIVQGFVKGKDFLHIKICKHEPDQNLE